MPKVVRILSIDGGGTLGIIPATILEYLEKKIGKSISECFHIVSGTSTGAILGANLCRPLHPVTAEEARLQYLVNAPKIFDRSLWRRIESLDGTRDERFDQRNLESVLGNSFGSLKLSDIKSTHYITCAYEIEKRVPILFRSWKAQGKNLKPEKGETQPNQDFYLRDVLRAATAAPTAFEPARICNMAKEQLDFIDGAVYANSPVRIAITQARKLYPNVKEFLIVSLGCGAAHKPIPYEKAINWGSAGWLFPIIDVLVNAQSQICDYDLDEEFSDSSYYRFIPDISSLGGSFSNPIYYDGRPETLEKVYNRGQELVRMEQKRLDELAEKLKDPRG